MSAGFVSAGVETPSKKTLSKPCRKAELGTDRPRHVLTREGKLDNFYVASGSDAKTPVSASPERTADPRLVLRLNFGTMTA